MHVWSGAGVLHVNELSWASYKHLVRAVQQSFPGSVHTWACQHMQYRQHKQGKAIYTLEHSGQLRHTAVFPRFSSHLSVLTHALQAT